MKNKDKILSLCCKSDLEKVISILNEWDPVGLIACGAPEDEYDCLANYILSMLYSTIAIEELKYNIIKELSSHFGFSIKDTNVELIEFCKKIYKWYINGSCKNNEKSRVTTVFKDALKGLSKFNNYHGISVNNLERFIVEPYKVLVDPDDLENEPYFMWIVMQECPGSQKGYFVVLDVNRLDWGIAEYLEPGYFSLVIGAYSLAEALDGM